MYDTDVAIVGAGPVGLVLAEYLAQRGVGVTLFERESAVGLEWRASTFHAATLELLETIGLGHELVAHGNKAPIEQHRAPDVGVIAEFDYGSVADLTQFPFRLQCPQQQLVALLEARLRGRSDVSLHFGEEFLTCTRDGRGVRVTTRTAEGERNLRAKFLVGADGGTSSVRKHFGIAFEGVTYEDRFLQMSTRFDVRQCLPDVRVANYVYDPDDNMQLLHLPGAWKVTIPIKAQEAESDALDPDAAAARLQRILQADVPIALDGVKIYKVHQRVAERFFGDGLVALCGDAAHVNSPVGGMGLNSGIHDAFDLGPRLERLLATDDADRLEAGTDELADYSARRRHVATDFVRRITHANTKNLAEADPRRRLELFEELRTIAADPARERERVLASSMLASLPEAAAPR